MNEWIFLIFKLFWGVNEFVCLGVAEFCRDDYVLLNTVEPDYTRSVLLQAPKRKTSVNLNSSLFTEIMIWLLKVILECAVPSGNYFISTKLHPPNVSACRRKEVCIYSWMRSSCSWGSSFHKLATSDLGSKGVDADSCALIHLQVRGNYFGFWGEQNLAYIVSF